MCGPDVIATVPAYGPTTEAGASGALFEDFSVDAGCCARSTIVRRATGAGLSLYVGGSGPLIVGLQKVTAVTSIQQLLQTAGCVSAGASGFLLALRCSEILNRDVCVSAQSWEQDQKRWVELRRESTMVRVFEPLIRGLEVVVPRLPVISNESILSSVRRGLNRRGSKLCFEPTEFLAYAFFQGILASGMFFLVALLWVSWSTAASAAAVGLLVIVAISLKELHDQGVQRLRQLKRQLPFCVDLISLMMQGGEHLPPSLRAVVTYSKGSPVAEEFGRILSETDLGMTEDFAWESFDDRMADIEVSEFVNTVVRGLKNGSRMCDVFENLSDELRLRRTQWAEKRSGQIQTMMTFPGFIIMFACMLVVVAPVALEMFTNSIF